MKTFWDYLEENQPDDDSDDKEQTSEAKEKERQEILDHVASYKIDTIRDRVAWLLNHFPSTRDSDITLQLKYWETFESDKYNGYSLTPSDLYNLTHLTTLVRARAKIQNEYHLFLASAEVRQKRGTLSDEEKQRAIEDKPNYPTFTVYMDESGKTAEHLIIGSVWFLSDYRALYRAVHDVRERYNFKKEFHFQELSKNDLPIYKHVIDLFWENSTAVSFKLISVQRANTGKTRDTLTDMYYHLLLRGIEHERDTGRAPLPRTLQVWIDAEETSLDKLMVANLNDRLKQASVTHFDKQLNVDQIHTVASETNLFLQMADLFTGSVNRVMNRAGTSQNQKDEFAEYLLHKFNIDINLPENENIGDIAVHMAI